MPDIAATWDYRCPFARSFHEHLVTALQAGAAWDVRFLPFSLDQAHVAEGQPDLWEAPTPAVLGRNGVDADAGFGHIGTGWPLERVLGLVRGWPELNELEHTTVSQ